MYKLYRIQIYIKKIVLVVVVYLKVIFEVH